MRLTDFEIGCEFVTGDDSRWRCTDVGSRVITAIRVDSATLESVDYSDLMVVVAGRETRHLTGEEAQAEGMFNGPPYAVREYVFDENDQEICEPVPRGTGN